MEIEEFIICDTDFLSRWMKGENFVKNYLELVLSTDHNLATTSITTSEIYYGAFINKWTKKRIEKVKSFLSSIKVFSYNFKHPDLKWALHSMVRHKNFLKG